MAESRRIDNWGIFRQAKDTIDATQMDKKETEENLVQRKKKERETFEQNYLDYVQNKIELTKSYKIFLGHPFKKMN